MMTMLRHVQISRGRSERDTGSLDALTHKKKISVFDDHVAASADLRRTRYRMDAWMQKGKSLP